MKRPRFIRIWALYFAVCAVGWCSLAGVGFILALAFMSDSSPSLGTYAQGMAQVSLVLIVYPLVAFMFVAGVLASVHSLLAFLMRSLAKNGEKRSASQDSVTPSFLATSVGSTSTSEAKRPFPIIRISGCIFIIVMGYAIIAGNAPRSLKESGLIPTVVTASVFFLPLILLPAILTVKLIKGHLVKVEQNGTPDADKLRR